eukprot:Awhi_evm1s13292
MPMNIIRDTNSNDDDDDDDDEQDGKNGARKAKVLDIITRINGLLVMPKLLILQQCHFLSLVNNAINLRSHFSFKKFICPTFIDLSHDLKDKLSD